MDEPQAAGLLTVATVQASLVHNGTHGMNIDQSRSTMSSRAEWVPEQDAAVVIRDLAFVQKNFGTRRRGALWLPPEEVYFLVRRGSLVLSLGERTLDLDEAFAVMCPSALRLGEFAVFNRLFDMGKVCRRADVYFSPRGAMRMYHVFNAEGYCRRQALSGETKALARVLVVHSSEPMLPLDEIHALASSAPPPLILAVTDMAEVSFIEVEAMARPPSNRKAIAIALGLTGSCAMLLSLGIGVVCARARSR